MVNQRRGLAGAALALGCLFCLLPAVRADWAVTLLERQAAAAGAVEYRHYSLGEAASGAEAEVQLALFSSKSATLRVIDQPNFDRHLADAMTQARTASRA